MNAKINYKDGLPQVEIDGKIVNALSYTSHGPQKPALDRAVRSGIKIFFVPLAAGMPEIGIGDGWQNFDRLLWSGENKYDFQVFDLYLDMLMEHKEQIYIIPRIEIITPLWFADKYPEELIGFENIPYAKTANCTKNKGHRRHASFASKPWKSATQDYINAMIEHVQKGPFADRVIGYMINTGGTEEAIHWGVQEGLVGDFSKPGIEGFRQWLSEKYKDDRALQQSWNQSDVTLSTVELPPYTERCSGSLGELKDPARDMRSIDYGAFLSDLMVDYILEYMGKAREKVGDDKLLGMFYGYCMWESGMVNGTPAKGHCALQQMLEAKEIDFITGITSYHNRQLGGPGSFMLPPQTMHLHHKILWTEEDLRTHIGNSGHNGDKLSSGADSSISIYRRQFAQRLTNNTQSWYFDMFGGWYDCDEFEEEFKKQAEIIENSIHKDTSSCAEVACIVSEFSPLYHRHYGTMNVHGKGAEIFKQYCDTVTEDLYRSGLAVDWYLSSDMGAVDFSQYKVVYFFNFDVATEEERKAVESLKSNNRTLVFLWAPGYMSPHSYGVEQVEALTGIRMSDKTLKAPAKVKITDYMTPMTCEMETTTSLGTDMVYSPLLIIEDEDATVFGRWIFNDAPASAFKRFPEWTSVVLGTGTSDRYLMRAVFKDAGCVVRCDNNDIVMENKSYIALHTFGPGPHLIYMPECEALINLFTDEIIEVVDGYAHAGLSGGYRTLVFEKKYKQFGKINDN